MHYYLGLMLLALHLNSCVNLPMPPKTPLCIYDNYSVGIGAIKPRFMCETINHTKFEIYWDSPSARNMVATPLEDYVKLNAYYKKVFDVLEKELMRKVNK